jgi:hypothetical protein
MEKVLTDLISKFRFVKLALVVCTIIGAFLVVAVVGRVALALLSSPITWVIGIIIFVVFNYGKMKGRK